MNLSHAGRRIIVSAAVVALFFIAAPVGAQEARAPFPPPQQMDRADAPTEFPYAWNVSFGVGKASGANPVGSSVDEEAGKVSTFELDSGVFVGGRVARRVWWRLGGEVEFAYASSGVLLTETDIEGRNVETSDFGPYSMTYGAGSVRLDLVDARITPFLTGGFAVVVSSVDGDRDTNMGFLFGGGLDVKIVNNVYLRGDVRGLRSNVDAPLLSRGIIDEALLSKALATQLLWTLGVAVRF